MTDDPLDVLRRVVDACAEVGVECAVIGAVARNAWAPPRATTDIDFAISVGAEGYGALVVALDQRGLAVKRTISSEPDAAVPDILLVEAASGIVRRIDLLIAKTPFEREAIAQAVPKDIGAQCRVVRPEHLIVYKLIAGRPRDVTDAEDVVRTCELAGAALDWGLVQKWAAEWGVEDRLQRLRHETHPT